MLKLKQNKGITLIALIITIIVMLILVVVTINVALNGGMFDKADEAATKTKISQIQEALAIKEAELIANNEGVVEVYDLEIDDLELPTELKNEFSRKLIIGTDGKLYYDASVVTDAKEQNVFKSMGIQEYVQSVIPPTSAPTEPPAETEGLQLLKIYRDQDISAVFFENQVFIGDRIGSAYPYVYNEEEKTITINDTPVGTITGTLSDDGKNIDVYIINKDYSLSIVEGTPEYLAKHGVYEGIYYNADEQKYACITKDYNYDEVGHVSILFENEDWTITRASGITSYVEIPDEGEGKIIKFANPILNPDGEKHYSGTLIEYTLLGTE